MNHQIEPSFSYKLKVMGKNFRVCFFYTFQPILGNKNFRYVTYATLVGEPAERVYVGTAIANPVDTFNFTKGCWLALKDIFLKQSVTISSNEFQIFLYSKRMSKLFGEALYKAIQKVESEKNAQEAPDDDIEFPF